MSANDRALVSEWLAAHCAADPLARTTATDLLDSFNSWLAKQGGDWRMAPRVFKREVLSVHSDVEWIRRNPNTMVHGLVLTNAH